MRRRRRGKRAGRGSPWQNKFPCCCREISAQSLQTEAKRQTDILRCANSAARLEQKQKRRNPPGIVCNKEIIALYPTLESNDIASATPNLLMCLLRLELSHRAVGSFR